LIEILSGLHRASGGGFALDGRDVTKASARQLKELGIAHIPEDRHRRGLLLEFNLADNTILGTQYRKPPVTTAGLLDEKAVFAKCNRLIRDFDVRPPNAALPARALSGGNQQKLIIGREFDIRPKLLLVSQPTRGVDIGAIEFIHRKLVELRDSGAAILLVSAELEEVMSLADRLLVMYQGRIVGEIDPQIAQQQEIGLLMTGGKKG
jgi:simple sugar transport system ATP-binding protein